MRKIAVTESKEREALFRNTAAKMGISEAVIEKDFWVCYMQNILLVDIHHLRSDAEYADKRSVKTA